MTDPSNRLAVLGVLLATFIAAPASAEPGPAAKPAEKAGPAKVKAAEAKAEKAEAKAEKAEKHAEKADEKAEKADEKAGEARQDLAKARAEFRGGLRELSDEVRDGKVKKEEIKDRLAKLHESLKDRKKAHQEAIKERWGDALAKPDAKEELRHHARRMAFLNRALLLAATERTGKDKDKLVDRIQKLIDKERERHEHAMDRIKSSPGTATAAASGATPGNETAPAAAKAGVPSATPAAAKPATPSAGDKK